MKKLSLVLCIAVLFLTGCGTPLISLDSNQSQTIATYAAGVLLKHSSAGKNGISSVTSTTTESADATATDESSSTDKTDTAKDSNGSTSDTDETQTYTFDQILNLSGCTLEYENFQISDAYTESDYYSMNASEGKTYLIMNLQLTNNTGADQTIDILTLKPKFSLNINGDTKVTALDTILTNDLSTTSMTISSGGTYGATLIFEISADLENNISTLTLNATVGDKTGTMQIQ